MVGIFVVLGILILVVTIFTLGGEKETFVKLTPVTAVFDDVGGLQVGGNIRFSGVKVGTVKRMSFYGHSQVLVTMNIEQAIQSFIHKDAFVKIGSDGLIGNKIIIIFGGTATSPQVEKDDRLRTENALTTDDILATLQENNKNLLVITKDFRNITQKINTGKGIIATLLNDPTIAQKVNVSVNDLQQTLANLKTVSESSKSVLSDLQVFSEKLNKKGNSIHDLASDTVVYRSIKATLAQLNNTSNSLTKFTANLKTTSDKLNQKDNAVGVLLNDTETATSLKTTLKNLESGSKKLDEDLEALQHNFLLRGFFKKKAKTENQ